MDTVLYKDSQNRIAFRTYRKPMDRNALLRYASHHPRCLVRNLLFGQFLQLKRNSTQEADYAEEECYLSLQLVERGYPKTIIEEARRKETGQDRKILLKDKEKAQPQRIVCGLQYAHLAEPIRKLIYKHWHLVAHMPGCENPPYIGLRKTQSIKDKLMHTDLAYHQTPPEKSGRGLIPCQHCHSYRQIITERPLILNGIDIKFNFTATCASKKVIYAIKCVCNKIYIGSCR